jgi:MerR family copper efflux transcriptional regulator
MRRTPIQPKPEMADARKEGLLNIGEAAAASGVSAKSIRHYEASGLMPAAKRTFANYRLYSQADIHTLRFIKSARALGFSIADIGKLVQLWHNQQRSSRDVKDLALQQVAELEARISEMQRMCNTLKQLATHCHGDARPDCPILEDLASHCC